MAITKISDIVEPEVFHKYMIEETIRNNSLISSGIVVPDSELDDLASTGGSQINMPFYKDLTNKSEELVEDTALTVGNVAAVSDIARLHMRGGAWGAADLAKALSGDDPLRAIASMVSNWWLTEEQNVLLASLMGMFADNAANDSSDLVSTAAAEAAASVKEWNDAGIPTVMNPIAIIDGQNLLGDAQEKFVAIMMHSKCYGDLQKQEVIDYERPSGTTLKIPYYMDKMVIVNDNCPTRAGTTDGTVYQSFLFGGGAIGRGEGAAPVPVETDRESLKGNDLLISRRHFLMHPRGIKWTETQITGGIKTPVLYGAGADDTAKLRAGDVGKATNWDRVYEKKNIRIAMLETN